MSPLDELLTKKMINDLQSAAYSFFSPQVLMFQTICNSAPVLVENKAPSFSLSCPPLANQQHELFLSFFEGMAQQLPVVNY